jgi:hypothetical protein
MNKVQSQWQPQLDESLQDIFMGSLSSSLNFDMSMSSGMEFPCSQDLGYLLESVVPTPSKHFQSRHSTNDDIPTDLWLTLEMEPENDLQQEPTKSQCIPTNTRQSKVRFSTVETRSYAILVGDHDCDDGLPIALDWKFNPQTTIEAVELEHEVYTRHYPARRLSYFERTVRLAEVSGIKVVPAFGISHQEHIIDTMSQLQGDLTTEQTRRTVSHTVVASVAA